MWVLLDGSGSCRHPKWPQHSTKNLPQQATPIRIKSELNPNFLKLTVSGGRRSEAQQQQEEHFQFFNPKKQKKHNGTTQCNCTILVTLRTRQFGVWNPTPETREKTFLISGVSYRYPPPPPPPPPPGCLPLIGGILLLRLKNNWNWSNRVWTAWKGP